jgi:hypothetical protein
VHRAALNDPKDRQKTSWNGKSEENIAIQRTMTVSWKPDTLSILSKVLDEAEKTFITGIVNIRFMGTSQNDSTSYILHQSPAF